MLNPLWILVLLPSLVIAAPSNSEKDMKGPVFIKEPDNRIDFSNSTGSVVECRANASPPPEIIWVRSDGTAVGDVRKERRNRKRKSTGFLFLLGAGIASSSAKWKSRFSTIPRRRLPTRSSRSSLRLFGKEPGRIHYLTGRSR